MKNAREKENYVYDFIDLVYSGELGRIDIENYIEKISDGFNLIKLNLLLEDVDSWLFLEKENKQSEFSTEDIQRAKEKLSEQKKEIPYRTFPEFKNKDGKIISEAMKILNLEKLLFPFEFYDIYELKRRINYHIKKASQPAKSENRKTKEELEKELLGIKNLENKFWEGIPIKEIVNHFEVMTKTPNKKGDYFLTVEQLISFLKRGFLKDMKQPVQKVNCATREKGFVIKRFYEFFDLAASQYGHVQKKEKFIALFIDCFNNWDPKTIGPFFKRNKTKKNW